VVYRRRVLGSTTIPLAVTILIGGVALIFDLVGVPGSILVIPVFWLSLCGITLLGAFRTVQDFRKRKAYHLTPLDWLFVLSLVVWGIVIASTLANVFVPRYPVAHLETGCYVMDGLWRWVECRGFALSWLAAFLLSLPYTLWLGFVLFLWGPFLAVPLWLFLLFPACYVWFKQRHV
jgi:hypothetical protein